MTRNKLISWFIASAIVLGMSSSATMAGEKKKELTFATISTEEMAAMAARWLNEAAQDTLFTASLVTWGTSSSGMIP